MSLVLKPRDGNPARFSGNFLFSGLTVEEDGACTSFTGIHNMRYTLAERRLLAVSGGIPNTKVSCLQQGFGNSSAKVVGVFDPLYPAIRSCVYPSIRPSICHSMLAYPSIHLSVVGCAIRSYPGWSFRSSV